ncbi:hypothetical protein A2U09_07700 [Fusobacterium necrophorum subsp. funduliforme]|uniref:hypothetical protein n=1 Tax=Fusobacterium necrophorum TaxID=859 RepID=UPI000787FCD4|nr:hypothetical protein [Fusobacterium necrophorum]KYM58532.1 hypothetical protein A2U09_07700 [Fusobacterium necrophorum subsp. funduliforme]
MSTKCLILKFERGKFQGITCQYDGYLENVGMKLLNGFNSNKKLNELIELGNISSLGNGIEDTVSYGEDGYVFSHIREIEEFTGNPDYVYVRFLDGWYFTNNARKCRSTLEKLTKKTIKERM